MLFVDLTDSSESPLLYSVVNALNPTSMYASMTKVTSWDIRSISFCYSSDASEANSIQLG